MQVMFPAYKKRPNILNLLGKQLNIRIGPIRVIELPSLGNVTVERTEDGTHFPASRTLMVKGLPNELPRTLLVVSEEVALIFPLRSDLVIPIGIIEEDDDVVECLTVGRVYGGEWIPSETETTTEEDS